MLSLLGITLRKVKKTDIWELYKLVNLPSIRKISINRADITREEHQEWFKAKLMDKLSLFFIICDTNNQIIGSVRFDKKKEIRKIITFVVSIYLKPEFQGKGIGTGILKEATKRVKRLRKPCRIIAYIDCGNTASLKSFANAGYIPLRKSTKNGRIFQIMKV